MSKLKYGIATFVVLIAGIAAVSTYALGANKAASALAATAPADAVAPTSDASTVVDTGWSERCDNKENKAVKKHCEVFSRLEMKASHMRVAEVVVGFPQDNSLPKGTARGVIIMPLGILLEPGATMAIDDGQSFAFKARFCVQEGCYGIVNLNKDILHSMEKGKDLNIFFKTADSRNVKLSLGLKGFDKMLGKIEQK